MATTEFPRDATLSAVEKLRARLETGAARLAGMWTAIKNRRASMQLLSWDDRMLSDIGLTRGDVHSAFSGRLDDDPSSRLTEFRRARRASRRRHWA